MAKKGSGFLKKPKNSKEAGAQVGLAFIGAAERGAGALGAGFISKGLIKDKVSQKIQGPVIGLVGILGDAFIGEPHLQRLCQGMAVYGIQASTSTFLLKDKSSNFGLGDVDEEDGMGDADDDDEALQGWQERYGSSNLRGTPSVFDDEIQMNGLGENDDDDTDELGDIADDLAD